MKPISYYSFLLLIGILFSGCVPNTATIPPTWTETRFPSPTSLPPTNTKTPTPTQTATLTPPATLEPEKAEETMRILFLEPVDCPAPCFWGITPDQTTLGEAKNIFTRFGLLLEYTSKRESKIGDWEFYNTQNDFDNGLSISVNLVAQNGIVKNFVIDMHPEDQQAGSHREWSAFSPETLINRYGAPSKVTFDVDRGPSPGYGIAMLFDDVDLIVFYSSGNLAPQLEICPLIDQMNHITIWMGKNPPNPPLNDRIPLEEATSMTMEEFSKLITSESSEVCFTLKEEMFP